MEQIICSDDDDYNGYPYLTLVLDEPDPKEVTKTGSIWKTIRHLLFGR